jgi:hypothetical protein
VVANEYNEEDEEGVGRSRKEEVTYKADGKMRNKKGRMGICFFVVYTLKVGKCCYSYT